MLLSPFSPVTTSHHHQQPAPPTTTTSHCPFDDVSYTSTNRLIPSLTFDSNSEPWINLFGSLLKIYRRKRDKLVECSSAARIPTMSGPFTAYCYRLVLDGIEHIAMVKVDVLLCLDCFHDGRFVIGHSSIDFLRVDATKEFDDLDGESWTNQETLLLLEAMEIYNENWNEIAEHVGTKPKAQCILHFICLPMEDGPLENIAVPSVSLSSNLSNRDDFERPRSSSNGDSAGSCLEDPDSEHRLPFAYFANPVMALVGGFLNSMLYMVIASKCSVIAYDVLIFLCFYLMRFHVP
ncbi:SWI/SNF complex subunit SWI3C [Camellia lanceoleosa]|uniref:SWI/SNF complex subunit SWI3C n=1 Tax=Camellia lanceoleosa TaxID=1840588 RepID=A0ACC0HRF9_9ERIC|nr:SWI/SNF complex subunit SWI3C [Camellia lanceoleosa]